MSRYSITRFDRTTEQTVTHIPATSMTQARELYQAEVARLQPGQSVELHDSKQARIVHRAIKQTAEERRAGANRYLETSLSQKQKAAERLLAEFQAQQTAACASDDADVTYAFRWADRAFEAAASLNVVRIARRYFISVGPERVAEMAQAQVMRAAKYPEFSSSPCHNLTALHTAQAWAEMAELFAAYFRALTDVAQY